MFAKRDKHYPGRSGQTSVATAVTNITEPVTKMNSGPSTLTVSPNMFQFGLTLKKHATLFLTGILSRLIPNLDSLDVCEEYLKVLGRKHSCVSCPGP